MIQNITIWIFCPYFQGDSPPLNLETINSSARNKGKLDFRNIRDIRNIVSVIENIYY